MISAVKRIVDATRNTLRGFAFAVRNEAAFRQEVAVLAIAVPAGFFVAPSAAWYVAMIGALILVLAVELLNTAIERLADQVSLERNPMLAAVKDCGSAAVACALALAGLIWIAALAARIGLL